VHRVLELHDFGGEQGPTEQGPTEQAVELAARGLGLRPGAGELSAIAGMLAAALREQPARRIAAAAEVWREQPFAYPAGEQLPLLTGVIDVLAREQDGGYLVLDYKSDPVGEGDDLEALVAREYALQRELYALAVLRSGARFVEVQHWFLARPQEWAAARFEAAELQELQVSLQARLRGALQAGFAVSPRPHRGLCATCPGRARLCSWPESATMAPGSVPAAGGS
jgi:ATP-dependent helicase/nuclease subunit A